MKLYALFSLLFFTSMASMQLKAEDAYEADLQQLQTKAEILQALADAANQKVADQPTPENKAAADAANLASVEADLHIAVHIATKLVEEYRAETESSSTPKPKPVMRADKATTADDPGSRFQYTSLLVLTNDLFLVGDKTADMSTTIKNLGTKNRQIDISVCGLHVRWQTLEKLTDELKASGYNRIGFVSDGAHRIKGVCAKYAGKESFE